MKCFVLFLWLSLVTLVLSSAVPLDSVKYTSIGCLNDLSWYPAVPSLEGQDPRLDGDYKQREKAIQKCALVSKQRGYKVFAIQDGGKCMSSSTAHNTINRAGRPTQCKREGRGEFMVNHFYVIGEMKNLFSTIGYDSLGCYKHEAGSTMTVLEGKDPDVLDGDYKLRTDAVDKCALAAMKRRHEVFAVHDGGQCLLSGTVNPTFNKYGTSQNCKGDGKGGSGSSHVYVIGGTQAILSRTEDGIIMGCYKDLPVRTMESLEGQDHLLDGDYKTRKDAIKKCLLVGRGRGYEVVGIQDGGMCVGSAKLRGFNKYGISHDCKSDGKGGPWATEVHAFNDVPDFLSSVKYESLGCYRDKRVRAIPSIERIDILLKDSYSTRNDAIQKCAVVAKVRGYKTFALQDGGMCVSGPTANETFDKYGKSQGCKNDGKGGPWANQVYRLTGTMEDFLYSVKYESLGCYREKRERAIPSMENRDILLKDSFSQRNLAIEKCALAAIIRGYKTFAVQDGGMCVGGPGAHKTFAKYGKSQDCQNDGKGGPWANQVYNLTGSLDGVLWSYDYFYKELGCFKDTQARALPSLEGQDPLLVAGNYTTRKFSFIKSRCALAAKRRGHKVFVAFYDGQCFSGPSTHQDFAKFGYYQDECWPMQITNAVYIIGYEDIDALLPLMEYKSVGCYKDSDERAITSAEGYRYSLPDPHMLSLNYKTRKQAIQKCALFAKLQGYKMFAVQDGGQCLTSRTAHLTYNKYGESQACKSDGKGGPWANQVYRLKERKN